jgi:hypothetical protein
MSSLGRPDSDSKVLTMRNQIMCMMVALLLVSCLSIDATLPAATFTPTIPVTSEAPLDATQEFYRSCIGWDCALEGIVYVGEVAIGNEAEGITVRLTQYSYCSPTRGEYETTTEANGEFEFQVYLHDTDTFWIEIEVDGYVPVRQSLGGFDCLYCSCEPIEIVLRSVE